MSLYKPELRSLVMSVRSDDFDPDDWWQVDAVAESWQKAWNTDALSLAMMLFGVMFHHLTDYKYAGRISEMRDAWFMWGRLSGEATEVAFPICAAVAAWTKWEADNA